MTHKQCSTRGSNIGSRRRIKIACVLFAALTLAACGTPTRQIAQAPTATTLPPVPTLQPTPTVSQNVPGGYLFVGDYDVQFVQWVGDPAGQVQGTYQRLHVPPGDSFGVEPKSGTFTLTQQPNSSDVQVTFDNGQSYLGTLQDNTLTLVVPSNNGELRTIEYRRATVEEYNTAARALTQQVEQQAAEYQAQVAQASATAAAQQARDQAMRAWQMAYEQAQTALEGLAVAPQADWFTERDEGQTAIVVRDAQATMETIRTIVANGDCFNFSYEVSNLGYHASQLDYVRDSFDYTIGNLNSATATMQAKRDTLGAAATENMINETNRIVETARQQIDLVNKKYDKAKQIVNAITQEADSLQCEQKQE